MSPSCFPHPCRSALSLTYDDATPCHLDEVAPALEARGFRGSFYTPVHEEFIERWDDWAALAARGHELGNHTLFHPCRQTPGWDWIKQYMRLNDYDVERWCAEVDLASALLKRVDGQTQRSFGNTCYHHQLGPNDAPTDLEDLIHPRFLCARGWAQEPTYSIDPLQYDSRNLGTLPCDAFHLDQILEAIDLCIQRGHWLILTLHRVEDEPGEYTFSKEWHQRLLDALADRREQLWVAPLKEVFLHLEQQYAD